MPFKKKKKKKRKYVSVFGESLRHLAKNYTEKCYLSSFMVKKEATSIFPFFLLLLLLSR